MEENSQNLRIRCKLGCSLDGKFESMLNSRIQNLLASECISFLSKTLYFHGVNFLQELGGGGRVKAMTAEWKLEVK